jgi:hypothetical protein
MPLAFFSQLAGYRKPLLKENNLFDYAEVIAWYHPEFCASQHTALRLVRNGIETHYLSFSPINLTAASKTPFAKLRVGIDAHFVPSYEDELLIQGFRNAWPDIKSELNGRQKSYLKNDSLKNVSDFHILAITAELSPERQAQIKKQFGRPSEVIELRSLNFEAMAERMEFLMEPDNLTKWAPWSGSYFRGAGAHNCASIVLDVLYAGGMHTYSNDLLTAAGLLLGAGYFVFCDHHAWLEAVIDIAVGCAASRAVAGAREGYLGIQSFLNVMATQGADNLPALLGLRFTSTLLCSVIGILKSGPLVPAFLTLPRDVMTLAQQAKVEEEVLFNYRFREQTDESARAALR